MAIGYTTTQKLLRAQKKGKRIVCLYPPYVGVTMDYKPRNTHDSKPWVVPGTDIRYFGHECEAR